MLSLTFKAAVMLVTFSLFQSNLYLVLAHEKGPKNIVQRDLCQTKYLSKTSPDLQLPFTRFTVLA